MSAIEWTDVTWNPVTGCSKVSPGCANCYAERMATTRLRGRAGYPGLPWTPENASTNVVLRPERLDEPLRWHTPRRVFVNSMSDLFHELVPVDFIAQVFDVMACATAACGKRHAHVEECWDGPPHQFQVLTKRPERMRSVVADEMPELVWQAWPGDRPLCVMLEAHWPLPNVWLGTSIENDRHGFRAGHLRETPAAVRFISAEPLLGPLPSLDLSGIDWLIVGGESGAGARPLDLSWVRDLIVMARAAGTAVFVKQLGAVWAREHRLPGKGGDPATWPADLRVREYPR